MGRCSGNEVVAGVSVGAPRRAEQGQRRMALLCLVMACQGRQINKLVTTLSERPGQESAGCVMSFCWERLACPWLSGRTKHARVGQNVPLH